MTRITIKEQGATVGRRGERLVVSRDGQVVESFRLQLVEELALVLQASLFVQHLPPAMADAFLASRFGSGWGRAFGTLPEGLDLEGIINRVDVA